MATLCRRRVSLAARAAAAYKAEASNEATLRVAHQHEHALHAMPRELRGARAAQTARAAGDERNLAVELKPVGRAAGVAFRHGSSHAA